MAKKKGDDPWDDSALVDALNRALSTYKGFHGIKDDGTTSNTEGFADAERISSACTESTEESKSHIMSDTREELCIDHVDNVGHDVSPLVQENQPGELSHSEQIPGSPIYDNTEGYDPTGYYQLLHRYYELEEQRIKILQQLCQASYWNHQMPCQSSTYHANQGSYISSLGGSPFSESDQFGNGHSRQPQVGMTPCNYCGYYGSCVPWNSIWTASQPSSNGDRKVSDIAADNTTAILQAAVSEAETAISSLKLEAPSGSVSCENGAGRGGTQGANASSPGQNISSETDLSEVLGAWYSAGFYTGKYTMEQSLKRG